MTATVQVTVKSSAGVFVAVTTVSDFTLPAPRIYDSVIEVMLDDEFVSAIERVVWRPISNHCVVYLTDMLVEKAVLSKCRAALENEGWSIS